MSRRWPGACLVLVAVCCGLAAAEEVLEFHRVHVPRARLDGVPLGPGRYLPLPLADFEAAVSGAAAAGPTGPRVIAARYLLARLADGSLGGTLAIDVEAGDAPAAIPLGAIDVRRVGVRTTDGEGEGVVFVAPDGAVALRTIESGTYSCEVSCGPLVPGVDGWMLPLAPARDTDVVLDVPAGLRPVLEGPAARRMSLTTGTDGRWRLRCGAESGVRIAFAAALQPPPGLSLWSDVDIRGGQAEVLTLVEPAAPWADGPVVIDAPSDLRPVAITTHPDGDPLEWSATDDDRIAIVMPAWAIGQRTPLVIRGLAALGVQRPWQVPLPRVAAARWKGGGVRIVVEPIRALNAVEVTHAAVITPQEAARWPLAAGRIVPDDRPSGRGRPATLHVEMQGPDGAVTIAVENRPAELDTARVTTVEVSPGAVLGRSACEVRVVAGEAFALSGRVMPGWIIDSVEAVDWVGGRDDAVRTRAVPAAERRLDWRVERAPTGNTLRIGLSEAATPSRELGLRITGHRPGIPLGGDFATGDMDMVRLDGESAATALIDVKVGPEALVEIDGEPAGWLPADNRLAPLVEEGPARARIRGGERQTSREARVVQRRPPVDARVQVRLTARDDVLAESFTFECAPQTGRIDAVVVHFSEPMGEDLDWSALVPTGIRLTARRLEANDSVRGTLPRGGDVAESWLVEIAPPLDATLTFRASRAVPFAEPLPVPLAWVEGAVTPRGTVAVRGAGAIRAGIVNRRLRELPPGDADAEDSAASAGEFAYGPPQAAPDGLPPADVVPDRVTTDARAWAWRETTTCWCHDSGGTEAETTFDIENHGREAVTVTIAAGRTVDAILVDGTAMPLDAAGDTGETVRVALPAARRRVKLLVRTLTARPTAFAAWSVDPIGCAVDMPVLDRELRVLLPPDLEIAALAPAFRRLEAESAGWSQRLFAADLRSLPAEPSFASAAATAGFEPRRYTVVSGPTGDRGLVVVRRRYVSMATAAAALVAAGIVAVVGRRWRAGPVLFAAALAIATLWVTDLAVPVVRAAWWGAASAALLPVLRWRGASGRRLVAAAAVALLAAPATGQDPPPPAPDSVPVFITTTADDAGGPPLALVPERLFRILVGQAALPAADCRITACHVRAAVQAGDPWEIELSMDCDAGGLVTLRQPVAARWMVVESATGVTATIDAEGRVLTLAAAAAGRGRVVVRAQPSFEWRGDLQFATLDLPPAPEATLVPVDDRGAPPPAGTTLCELTRGGGPFVAAVPLTAVSQTGFDVARAERVRVLTGIDGRLRFTTTMRQAESENDISWESGGCRVEARFSVDVGTDAIAGVVLRADPPLVPAPRDDETADGRLEPLGAGRYRLDLDSAALGTRTVTATFRMPLPDPVGSFVVPGVWLEAVTNDVRTVRCRVAADLAATAEPPPGASPVAPREGGEAAGPAWRYEVAAGAVVPRGALVVERRRTPVRGVQNLAVEFATDNVALRLQAQFDAVATPLVQIPIEIPPSSLVDRVAVFEEGVAPVEAGGPAPVDMLWERTAPDRIVAVLQQPRAGRFRLEADVRVPIRPATRGRLPLVRSIIAGGAPLFVTWGTAPGTGFAVTVATDETTGDLRPAGDVREVIEGEPGPGYEIVESSAVVAAAEPPAEVPPQPGNEPPLDRRVELTDVLLSIDAAGRTWGMVRFDVVTTDPLVAVRMPAGLRLYDLLVDGRDGGAVPRTADTWEVRLHDVSWPRNIVAVFAGTLAVGDRTRPLRLEAPRIVDLPSSSTLWTMVPPAGYAAEIESPALALDRVTAAALRLAAARRLDDDFRRAVAAATGGERERLQAFATIREKSAPQPLETLLAGAGDAVPKAGRRSHAEAADAIAFRVFPGGDRDRWPRFGLSAVLGGCGLVVAAVVRRGGRPRRSAAWVPPLACVLAGGAWATWLTPSLPGWCAIGLGVVLLVARLREQRRGGWADVAAG